MTYELLTPGNKVVYSLSKDIFINEGTLTFEIVPSDGLDTSLFESYILKSQLTLSGNDLSVKNKFNSGNNSFLDSDTIELPLYSLPNTIMSDASSTADKFLNTALMNIDEDTGDISIGTSNIDERVFIDGTVNAHAFIGDGFNLINLGYTRWLPIDNGIYYPNRNVGFGTQSPSEAMHIVGTWNITEELVIRDTLFATFSGDSMDIYNFNASNLASGYLDNDRLFGEYHNMSGVGTITQGEWLGGIIDDTYINKTKFSRYLYNFQSEERFIYS